MDWANIFFTSREAGIEIKLELEANITYLLNEIQRKQMYSFIYCNAFLGY
jgi:hypothetical protein